MSAAAFQIELTPEPLPAQTDLGQLPFAVLLANARMLSVTGILDLRGEKRIYIARGTPVHVESDLADETSELYLLRAGAVDASEIEPARELARSRGGKIGEALLGLGLLEANELFEHTRNRARDSLIACFGWERGSVVWEPRERFGPELLPVPIDVVKVFFDGILRFYDRRRLDRELPVDDASRLYLVPSPRIEVQAAHVGTIETRLIKLAAGRPSLPSAAMAVGISPDDLRRRLYALYCLGVVGFEVDPLLEPEPVAPPPPRPPPTAGGHVPRAGTTGKWPTVTTSSGTPAPPRRESSIPPPPRPSQMPPARSSQLPPTPRETTSPGFVPPQRSSQLPPPPSSGTSPGRPMPSALKGKAPGPAKGAAPSRGMFGPHAVVKTGKPTKSVHAYIEDAELARAQKDWEAAYLALEYALELEPENAFIWAEKAYTMMKHDPRAFGKEANALARDARKADPGLPMPYVVLGMLMEQIRETERAIQMYRVALQKDPVCEPAQTLLEQIEVKRR